MCDSCEPLGSWPFHVCAGLFLFWLWLFSKNLIEHRKLPNGFFGIRTYITKHGTATILPHVTTLFKSWFNRTVYHTSDFCMNYGTIPLVAIVADGARIQLFRSTIPLTYYDYYVWLFCSRITFITAWLVHFPNISSNVALLLSFSHSTSQGYSFNS